MSQVVEVRFIDSVHGVFFDRMVLPASKTPRNQEHREAIEMGLDFFCGVQGGIELKEMALTGEAFGRNGEYWRYIYACTLGLENMQRELTAVLFTTYRHPDRVGMEVQKLPPPRIEDIAP